eukprot:scaffold2208_cov237-Pinguiococcus_pyrenoidosus.AAC.3
MGAAVGGSLLAPSAAPCPSMVPSLHAAVGESGGKSFKIDILELPLSLKVLLVGRLRPPAVLLHAS